MAQVLLGNNKIATFKDSSLASDHPFKNWWLSLLMLILCYLCQNLCLQIASLRHCKTPSCRLELLLSRRVDQGKSILSTSLGDILKVDREWVRNDAHRFEKPLMARHCSMHTLGGSAEAKTLLKQQNALACQFARRTKQSNRYLRVTNPVDCNRVCKKTSQKEQQQEPCTSK